MTEPETPGERSEVVLSRQAARAGVAAALIVTITAFGVGLGIGRSLVPAPAPRGPERVLDAVPGEGLVQLLSEVERARVARASAAVRYPEWVDGEGRAEVPEAPAEVPGVDAKLAPPPGFEAPHADAPGTGAWIIGFGELGSEVEAALLRDSLRGGGLQAWVVALRVAGAPKWTVHAGGYATEEEARQALDAVRTAAGPAGVSAAVAKNPAT